MFSLNKIEDLTVIVPNYNKAQFLVQCIDSIFSQTVQPQEVIVVDDSSIDNSIEILHILQEKYERLKVIKLEKNSGVSVARNTGISECKTKYITFLDSDDFNVNPEKYENELNLIKKKGDGYLVYSEIVCADIDGNLIPRRHYHFFNMKGKCTAECLTYSMFFYGPFDYIVETDLVKRIGGFTFYRNLYEDLDLLVRLSFVCKFVCTNKLGRAYRSTPDGLSKAKKEEHQSALKEIKSTYYNQLPVVSKIRCGIVKLKYKFIRFIRSII